MNTTCNSYFTMRLKLRDIYIKHVAKAYKTAEEYNENLIYSWKALALHVNKAYAKLANRLKIEFVKDDPYSNFNEMNKDIDVNNRLKIYTNNSQHPIWDEEENYKFRVFHDYYGHYLHQKPFTFYGEIFVYQRHREEVPNNARIALMTELVGELCYYFYFKKYVDAHKVCNLSEFDPATIKLI